MVNEYKKIVLLVGLEAMKDYEFRLIKSLLVKDLKLTKNMQEDYDRIRIADLMEEKFHRDAGLGKLITLCKDIPALADLAETLKTRRLKVKRKSKGENKPTGKKKSTGKKVEQDESPTAQSRSTTNTDSEPESEEEIPSLKHQKRKPTSVKKKERLKFSQENKMKKSEDPKRTQLPPEQSRFMEPSATSEEQTEVCPQTPHGAPPEPSNSPPIKRPKIKKSVPLVNKQEKISSSFQEGQEMEATNSKTNNMKVQESQGQRPLPQLSEIGVKPPQCIIHTHQMPPTPPTAPPSSVHTPQNPPTAPPSSVHTPQKPPTAPPSSVHTPQKPPTVPLSSVHTSQKPPTLSPSSVHTPQKPPTAPPSSVHIPQKPPTVLPSSVHTPQKPPTAPTSSVHIPQKPPTVLPSSVHTPQKPPTVPLNSVHIPQKPPTAPPSSVHASQKPPTAPPSSVHTPQMPPTAPSGKTNTFHLLLTLPSGVQTSPMSSPSPSGRIQTPHFSPTSSRGIQGPHTSPTSCSKIQTPQMPPAAPDSRTPTPHLPRTSPSEFQTTHMCPEDPSGKIQTPHFSPTSSRGIQGPYSSPASSSRIQTPQIHSTEPSTIIQNPQVWPATPSASLQTPQKTVTSFSSGLPTNPRLKTVPKEASEECGHQKGPKEVVVLKVTEPFTYEFKEGGKKMFHATVATESEFFRVKVFDINLKDKFIPKTVIAISDYIGRNGFLELYSASTVSHVSADRKMEISKTLIKNANATPKIEYLCSRSTTKYVNGVYTVYKKNVREDCTYYEIQDDTGKMEVVVYGRLTYINCEEGDKLNLFCFRVSASQLLAFFFKVIKGSKSKICPLNRDSHMDTSQESSLKPGYH
uniref:Uncharacterized protein n=1 Tax=Spermophilus dauricus TaxID=99837 RepID=A0A8C9Q6H4_SPEDA